MFRAARLGHAWAQHAVSCVLMDAKEVAFDHVEAPKWAAEASDQGFAPHPAFTAARFYECGYVAERSIRRWQYAFDFYSKAFELGDLYAAYKLALCWLFGLNAVKIDKVKGFELALQAHQAGVPGSASLLAECYEKGWGTQTNQDQFLKLLESAPLDPFAMCRRGLYLQHGGREKEGKALLKAAVAQLVVMARERDVRAQFHVAHCYFDGDGIDQDKPTAKAWMKRAAVQGYYLAQIELGSGAHCGALVQAFDEREKFTSLAADQQGLLLLDCCI